MNWNKIIWFHHTSNKSGRESRVIVFVAPMQSVEHSVAHRHMIPPIVFCWSLTTTTHPRARTVPLHRTRRAADGLIDVPADIAHAFGDEGELVAEMSSALIAGLQNTSAFALSERTPATLPEGFEQHALGMMDWRCGAGVIRNKTRSFV
jgi:hypothetical protein